MSKWIAAQGATSQILERCDGLGPITMSQREHFRLFILEFSMVHAGGEMAYGTAQFTELHELKTVWYVVLGF